MESRRNFMKTGALLGGAMTFSCASSISQVADDLKKSRHHFKVSCAAYSYREYLTKGKMTLDDVIEKCVELDIDAVELTSYYFPEVITSEYLTHLKRITFLNGLDISGTAIRNNFCLPPGEELDKEIKHVIKWIDYAADFTAPSIRIFAGKIPKGVSDEQAIGWCVDGIKRCLDHAGKRGVFLALENHHGIVARAKTMKKICDKVGPHPWFGVNLDTGNFTTDPYGDLKIMAPYTVTVQVKDYVMEADGKTKKDADLKKILDILRDVNYRGYLALEYEGKEDPMTGVPKWINKLKREATR